MGLLFTREVHKEVARRHSSEVNKAIGACGVELQYSHEKPHNRHQNQNYFVLAVQLMEQYYSFLKGNIILTFPAVWNYFGGHITKFMITVS